MALFKRAYKKAKSIDDVARIHKRYNRLIDKVDKALDYLTLGGFAVLGISYLMHKPDINDDLLHVLFGKSAAVAGRRGWNFLADESETMEDLAESEKSSGVPYSIRDAPLSAERVLKIDHFSNVGGLLSSAVAGIVLEISQLLNIAPGGFSIFDVAYDVAGGFSEFGQGYISNYLKKRSYDAAQSRGYEILGRKANQPYPETGKEPLPSPYRQLRRGPYHP